MRGACKLVRCPFFEGLHVQANGRQLAPVIGLFSVDAAPVAEKPVFQRIGIKRGFFDRLNAGGLQPVLHKIFQRKLEAPILACCKEPFTGLIILQKGCPEFSTDLIRTL